YAADIGPRGGRSRLTGSAGRVPPAREQSFTLELKQPPFRSHWHDEVATTGLPADARINTADEDTLERSVGWTTFESRNDGLVSKPITPSAAACSATFAARIDTASARDIVPDGFVRSPHRHDSRAVHPLTALGVSSCGVAAALISSLFVSERQRHAAQAIPLVETAVVPFRASLSRACGQP